MKKITLFILLLFMLLPSAVYAVDGYVLLPMSAAKVSSGDSNFINSGAASNPTDGGYAILFDDTDMECVLWDIQLPSNYSGGTMTVRSTYTAASATSGTWDPEVYIMATTPGDSSDLDDSSFSTTNEISGGEAVPGTAGYLGSYSITISNTDGAAANDHAIIKHCRDTDDADDTASGDIEERSMVLEY